MCNYRFYIKLIHVGHDCWPLSDEMLLTTIGISNIGSITQLTRAITDPFVKVYVNFSQH